MTHDDIIMTKRLNLTEIIGQGRDRACYAHPLVADLCVKVALKSEHQTLRERNYLMFLKQHQADLSAISCYRGDVMTDHGQGYLFELERLPDGQVAPTLKQAIISGSLTQQQVLDELRKLRDYLFKNAIFVRDLSPTNIVCKPRKDGHLDFKIIDGIGSPNHNPLTIRWRFLVERAIDKAWQRLERKVKQLGPE